jgi:hypothetical protein
MMIVESPDLSIFEKAKTTEKSSLKLKDWIRIP